MLIKLIRIFCITGGLILFTGTNLHGQTLSDGEVSDLGFMREEEKLARDVYQHLYSIWSQPIFNTIAVSEQRHMDAILTLLNYYGLTDPVANNSAGIFANSSLQQLYDDLIVQGGASLIAALEVGILIEETDIADLEAATGNTSQNNIQRVYGNLLKGSNNHLAAFISNLESAGGNYNGGNQSGGSTSQGTSVYEPISETLYIPAIDVTDESGSTLVYDAILRIVETFPQALEVVSVTETDKTPNSVHATFNYQTGTMVIPSLKVGSLIVDAVNDTYYSAVLQLATGTGSASIFIVSDTQASQ